MCTTNFYSTWESFILMMQYSVWAVVYCGLLVSRSRFSYREWDGEGGMGGRKKPSLGWRDPCDLVCLYRVWKSLNVREASIGIPPHLNPRSTL
jgi:hypothetical protein